MPKAKHGSHVAVATRPAARASTPTQAAYDEFRDARGKPRRPVDQIGAAELVALAPRQIEGVE